MEPYLLAAAIYTIVVAAIIRFFQVIRKQDDEIRRLTNEWIDRASDVGPSPKEH